MSVILRSAVLLRVLLRNAILIRVILRNDIFITVILRNAILIRILLMSVILMKAVMPKFFIGQPRMRYVDKARIVSFELGTIMSSTTNVGLGYKRFLVIE